MLTVTGARIAFFDCWYDDEPLKCIDEYYEHTLMPATLILENLGFSAPESICQQRGRL